MGFFPINPYAHGTSPGFHIYDFRIVPQVEIHGNIYRKATCEDLGGLQSVRKPGCGTGKVLVLVSYYGFRYYDPETGRWLSRDPLGEFSALNIYAFISNDPLNDFDLIGLTSYKGGSGANYRPDPFGHGSNADGSPRDPHIDRIEKGGQKSRYNPDGSPRKGAGNVPRKDQQAMGRAVSKLASILSRFVTLPVMLYVEPPEIEYPEPKDSVSPACSEVKPCEWKCKCPSGFINFGGQKIYKQKEAPSPDWLCDDAEFIL